ncbi:MAG: CorA family divalent cation transporter [Pseudolabrys sp.]
MDDNSNTSPLGTQPGSIVATIVSARSIQRAATTADLRKFVETGRFFWLDIVGSDEAVRATFLRELGLKEEDSVWMQRFGQTGRMTIGQEALRTVAWLSEVSPSLTEIHLLASRKYILTVWTGDASALNEIRAQFAERAEELEKSPYQAAAIVLQLLLGTLDQATSAIDVRLQEFREQLKRNPTTIDLTMLTGRLQSLLTAWSAIDRYSTAVRSAIVGIEALGIDQRGAAELNNYADQVDDIEHRLHERYQWGADIAQSSAAAIAKRQGEQINRLTIVSLMFLPITFLTGFFGMNFDWMINTLGSPAAFFLLGILLPTASVIVTVLWLKRRGLM